MKSTGIEQIASAQSGKVAPLTIEQVYRNRDWIELYGIILEPSASPRDRHRQYTDSGLLNGGRVILEMRLT